MYTLYGWSIDYNLNDIYAEDIFLGDYETYEEAQEVGEKLVKENKIKMFDIYL